MDPFHAYHVFLLFLQVEDHDLMVIFHQLLKVIQPIIAYKVYVILPTYALHLIYNVFKL